jgi:type IV pilus assembly protein PilE
MKLIRRFATCLGRQGGLTLIELMVVVAVLAILATIAIPAYESLMARVRRADGRAAAMAIAHAEERHFSIYQTYTVSRDDLNKLAGLDAEVADGDSAKGYYLVAITGDPCGDIARCFRVTATPQKADVECTSMTLDSAGNRGGSPSGTNKCW